jgi:hypothetical protein
MIDNICLKIRYDFAGQFHRRYAFLRLVRFAAVWRRVNRA